MHNYHAVVADLIKTLLEKDPLPWASQRVNDETYIIATTTRTVIIKTKDPAVASEVLAFANASKLKGAATKATPVAV